MNILITGAAGYIGSVTLNNLRKKSKFAVFGIDNYQGKKSFYKKKQANINKYDYGNNKSISYFLKKKKIDVVIHFAANTNVLDSIKNPKIFYNDLKKTKKLIDICIRNNVKYFFFSSSAAVYKNSNKKIKENFKTLPKSPYGIVKKKIENYLILKAKKNFQVNILRFFNVIGANNKLSAGQVYNNGNLILNLYQSTFNNKSFYLYGNYNQKNKDVSPIRDYFDVNIIPEVIYKLLFKKNKKNYEVYNLGSGKGLSVLKFINKFENITKKKLNIYNKKKNKKEITISIADIGKLTKIIGKIKNNNLNNSIKSHIKWLKKTNV